MAPDWPPTPVKMKGGQQQIKKGHTSATDTVANQRKAAAVGQRTSVWMLHVYSRLQKCGAPTLPGGYWHGLNPPWHSTGEPITGATTNVHKSENKHNIRKLQEDQGPHSYWQIIYHIF